MSISEYKNTHMTASSQTSSTDLWNHDVELQNQRLSEDAGRLFAREGDELEVWRFSYPKLVKLPIKGLGMLHQHWQEVIEQEDIFYVIRQANTLSRLRISRETFQVLLSHNRVFPFFMGTVQAFGYRNKEDNGTWDNFHWRQSGKDMRNFEICYIVRFFEENHRGRGDPWSLRQTGIYQSVDCSKGISIFILLQPSSYIEKRLESKLLATTEDSSLKGLRHILLHDVFLSASLVNWRGYIETQVSELEELEEKTTFSKADYLDKNDYSLRFADRQSLQSLRRKLLKAARLLDCSVHIGEMMKKLCKDLGLSELHRFKGALLHELDDYIFEASYHRRVVADLLQRSTDTCELLTSILQYRAGTLTLESTKTLVRIASQGEIDGKVAQKTSTSATSLTFAATVYLPASLLSAIFCSNLVEVRNGQFVIAQQFWKFIIILIPMIIVTFALVATSQWYWMRSYRRLTNDTIPGDRGATT